MDDQSTDTEEPLPLPMEWRILALPMRLWNAIRLLVLFSALLFSNCTSARAQQAGGQRKVLNQVTPQYPELARRMSLEGTVKLTVTVTASGTPQSIEATGGSPLLVKAAQDAIHKWKWAPAPQETLEFVELRFHPN